MMLMTMLCHAFQPAIRPELPAPSMKSCFHAEVSALKDPDLHLPLLRKLHQQSKGALHQDSCSTIPSRLAGFTQMTAIKAKLSPCSEIRVSKTGRMSIARGMGVQRVPFSCYDRCLPWFSSFERYKLMQVG